MTLPTTKRAGVCLHVTSLPGEYGIGEIGRASRNFIDAMTEMGLAYWQFLPTGPTAYGDSPYQPLSSFAGNELLIDTENLLQRGLIMPREAQELCVLPHDTVDYGGLIPLKNSLLKAAADRFSSRASSQLKSAYDSFLASNDKQWLNDYALYRVLKTLNSERPWPEWEPHFVHRDAQSLKQLTLAAGPAIEQIVRRQRLWNRYSTGLKECFCSS